MRAWFVFFLIAQASTLSATEVVATVDQQPITDKDIVKFAQQSPLLANYLAVPGGPMRLLQLMIEDQLLLREGERREIPRPADGSDTLYLMALQDELVPACREPKPEDIERFYADNTGQFSTPLMLRLSRIGLTASAEEADAVGDRLSEIKRQLDSGAVDFATVADAISEDIIGNGRGGDIGFTPINTKDNPLLATFAESPLDTIIGPIYEHGMVYIYRVTDRREPIVEPFATIKSEVGSVWAKSCREEKLDALITELKARWPVELLVDSIDIVPEKSP